MTAPQPANTARLFHEIGPLMLPPGLGGGGGGGGGWVDSCRWTWYLCETGLAKRRATDEMLYEESRLLGNPAALPEQVSAPPRWTPLHMKLKHCLHIVLAQNASISSF